MQLSHRPHAVSAGLDDPNLVSLQISGRHVLVEMSRQRDLVADFGLVIIDPCIVHIRAHLGNHVVIDHRAVLGRGEAGIDIGLERHPLRWQRDVLVVPQVRVWLDVALGAGHRVGAGALQISDVLEMTVSDANQFFANLPPVRRVWKP